LLWAWWSSWSCSWSWSLWPSVPTWASLPGKYLIWVKHSIVVFNHYIYTSMMSSKPIGKCARNHKNNSNSCESHLHFFFSIQFRSLFC
jgi:hypothetical protein